MADVPANFERTTSLKDGLEEQVEAGKNPDTPTSSRIRVTRQHRSDPAKVTENTVRHTTK